MTKDMKRVNRVARAGVVILASACVLSPVAVFAGPKDTIDESAKGSVSLYNRQVPQSRWMLEYKKALCISLVLFIAGLVLLHVVRKKHTRL